MKTIDELVELLGRMGFSGAGGPEVEDEFHNFIALNIPKQHPARDPLDNFYLAMQGISLRPRIQRRESIKLPCARRPARCKFG